MAVLSVPQPLRAQLGVEASDSLVEVLRQLEQDQERRRAEQRQSLFEVLDERVLRHIAESEERLRAEIGQVRTEVAKEIGEVRTEIANLRTEVAAEIANLRTEVATEIGQVRTEVAREIGEVRKEITVQTRWILTVMTAAAILIPVVQRVIAAVLP